MLNILHSLVTTNSASTPMQRTRMAILMEDAAEVDRLMLVISAT